MLNEIILGVVQGVTEWLPVSSSGHLVITQELLGVKDNIAMDVMLHIGTVLIVCWIFRNEIFKIIRSFIHYFKTGKTDDDAKMGLFVIVASFPTAVIGITLNDQIEAAFSSLLAVGLALVLTGTLLWFTKYNVKRKKLDWKRSILIGIAQGCAIFPGISRSGTTISTGLLLGVDKEKAARFSFLLFIPAALGALLFQLDEFVVVDYTGIAIGTITAMVVSYFVIGFLLKIIKKGVLHWFSYYCWTLGIVLLISQSI